VRTYYFSGIIMHISINERPFKLEEQSSLADALEQLDITPNGLAVAVNSTVIPYDQWQSCALKENDAVMIIRATQGG
jgi:sulfur carrier protein